MMVILAGILGIGLSFVIILIKEFIKNIKEEERNKISEAKALVLNSVFELIPKRIK